VLNITELFHLSDHFVLITGKNPPHIRTLAREIEDQIEKQMEISPRREGKVESRWMILDYGDVIVHIMGSQERRHYGLEELWAKASAITYH
jgi:ribosome-associated protein